MPFFCFAATKYNYITIISTLHRKMCYNISGIFYLSAEIIILVISCYSSQSRISIHVFGWWFRSPLPRNIFKKEKKNKKKIIDLFCRNIFQLWKCGTFNEKFSYLHRIIVVLTLVHFDSVPITVKNPLCWRNWGMLYGVFCLPLTLCYPALQQ